MMKIGGPPARQAALETHRTVRVLHKQGHTDMRIIYNYRQDNDCRWLFIVCCDEFGGDAHSAPQRDVIFDETITIIVKGEFIPTQYDTLDGTIKPLSYIHKNGNTVTLTLFGNRHNSFGALHHINEGQRWIGPDAWRTSGYNWSYEYRLRRLGILKSPVIRIYSK